MNRYNADMTVGESGRKIDDYVDEQRRQDAYFRYEPAELIGRPMEDMLTPASKTVRKNCWS